MIVAGNHWLGAARLAAWDRTIWITVYPIAADQHPETLRYIEQLTADSFDEISAFFAREAARNGLVITEPAHFQLAPMPASQPPDLPESANPLVIAGWSLRMRWWAWRQSRQDGLPAPDIQVFMRYRTAEGMPGLDRSVGVQKGRYTLIQAYASRQKAPRNRFVVAHELLHVLGATDKYQPGTGLPVVPEGLANPEATPLYPQRSAEIMAGAVALGPRTARMPVSLREVVVGKATAREIGWAE